MRLKQAFLASPGPKTGKEALVLGLKGFCMGLADIIPGVSGGTIAFITGIYEDLISAVRSFDARFFSRLFHLDISGVLSTAHVRFLVPLMLGIGTALVSASRLMHYLMDRYPVSVWSLFFGLILASILVIGRGLDLKSLRLPVCLVAGCVASYWIVGTIPVTTPESSWFIFLSGAVAVCAMILPGISGAFILLILGKYEFITGTLKNPFLLSNIFVIVTFVCGCGVGLAAFSRVLHYFLSHRRQETLAILTGFMVGALRKVWPWKEAVKTKLVEGKVLVLQEANFLPHQVDRDLVVALLLMVVGFAAVMLLDRVFGGTGTEAVPHFDQAENH